MHIPKTPIITDTHCVNPVESDIVYNGICHMYCTLPSCTVTVLMLKLFDSRQPSLLAPRSRQPSTAPRSRQRRDREGHRAQSAKPCFEEKCETLLRKKVRNLSSEGARSPKKENPSNLRHSTDLRERRQDEGVRRMQHPQDALELFPHFHWSRSNSWVRGVCEKRTAESS